MVFQGLAVVLGKLRRPELIAQDRHKDFGLQGERAGPRGAYASSASISRIVTS